ncbi:acid phosphatase type 7 [Hyalella azteca]|uniref:Purple acid phosphatase n=1 Tax=Hyalella azteca TaxID=294128 RepID=A0A979FTR5_HYAAZ|nr:acid phosphatase type 7 [Hyalella azteca]
MRFERLFKFLSVAAVFMFASQCLAKHGNRVDENQRLNSLDSVPDWQPRHVHLAYGRNTSSVVVTWSTISNTSDSLVEWGTDLFDLNAVSSGVSTVFVDGGSLKATQFIHRVHLYGLQPATTYYYHAGSVIQIITHDLTDYHAGSSQGWSAVFGFKTVPAGTRGWPLRLAKVTCPLTHQMTCSLYQMTCPLYQVMCPLYQVMCPLYQVTCPLYQVMCPLYQVMCPLYQVMCPLYQVTCPLYQVTCPLYQVTCPLYQSLTRLQQEAHQGMYDAVLHVGDMAYDMISDNGSMGDAFMEQIEPVAAYLPYMTCPGNHESAYNFSQYRNRFSMPNYEDTESIFYSFDMGPVHFVSISTEVYYYGLLREISRQYTWLIQDLEAANTAEARAERPWIILYGHRPMYCSTNDKDDCTHVNCRTRVGLPFTNWTTALCENRGPVHVTTGSAGCKEDLDGFQLEQPAWSAVRVKDYGYTRLTVHNHTHLYWEQVSDDQAGVLTDSVWLVRDSHEPFDTS